MLKNQFSIIKKIYVCSLLYITTSIYSLSAQCPAGLSGTYSIGPTGTFPSITTAILTLHTNGLANNVILELQSGYISSVETYPIVFPAIPCQNTFSITLRPATGTSGFTISNNSSVQTLVLDSIQNLIIDGRPGGFGSAKELTIETTTINGNVINFINDATANIVQYLFIKSTPTSSTNGIVIFNTTAHTTGNDNNKIRHCDIGNPAAFSSNLIYASGTVGKENNNNEITDNNFLNFFSNSVNSSGISITQNNSNYTILNNSFYQTVGPANFGAAGVTNAAIRINTMFGDGFTINNNSIGGTAPGCGGTPTTYSGPGSFMGIYYNTDTLGVSSINNNTIANLSLTLTSNNSLAAGIVIDGGKINIGTSVGNTIGSQGIINSITINSTATGTNPIARFAGIYSSTLDTVSIFNNFIGGIATNGTGRMVAYGIQLAGTLACYNLNNNTIGNPSLANSFTNNASTYALLHGINSTASSALRTQTFNGNLIANLNNPTTNTNTQVAGIYTSAGKHSLNNNIIRDITGASSSSGTNTASIIGISCIGGTAIQSVSGNRIYGMRNNHPSGSPAVIGINVCNSSTTATIAVSNNFVHSLSAAGSGNAILTGIHSACGNTAISNNMIRLGIDASGNSVSGNYEIRGIYQGLLTANQKTSFNSVYIGGSYSGTQNTYSFYNLDSLVIKRISSNIFVNARSNTSGSGKNYAVLLRGNKKKPQGLTMNANLLFAPGTAGYIGYFNGNSYNNFGEWRDVTGVDSLSGKGNPGYINPTGNVTDINLHLSGTTPAEAAGIPDTLITTDFDNNIRADFSPTDIGADAGNFTPIDVIAPTISFTALKNTTSIANLTIRTKITDAGSGIYTSGSLQPKLWFRRIAPSVTTWATTAGTLVAGNGNDGTWDFVIDYNMLGITPAVQDVYQYYFTAQDLSSNIEISPAISASHTDVNTQVTPPANLLSYELLAIVPASVNVGAGEQFTSLTNTGGLFQFLNRSVITGDVSVNITSELAENGTHSLNADSTYGHQLTIRPADATIKAIYNSSDLSVDMLRLYNMNNIVFDGRYNGSGKYLRLINTHAVTANCKSVFLLDSSSTNIIIRNCIIENNFDFTTGFQYHANIVIGEYGINKNIEIKNNQIRDAVGSPGIAGLSRQCILSTSNSNKLIVIKGNEIFNFTLHGINFDRIGDSCLVDSNHFYFNSLLPVTALPTVVNFANGKSHIVSHNFIGGSAPGCSGSPWTFSNGYGAPLTGIYINRLGVGGLPSYITHNTIQNINMTYVGEASLKAIEAYGNMIVTDNLIGHPTLANSIVNAGINFGAFTFGISTSGTDSSVVRNNTVANVTASGTDNNASLVGLYLAGNGKGIVKGNKIYALTASSTSMASLNTLSGVNLWNGLRGYEFEDNTIHNLKGINTAPNTKVIAVNISSGGNSNINSIKRNRIYNIENRSDSGWIYGIYSPLSSFQIENNQIAITNGNNTNRTNIFGIFDQSDSSYLYYNTIYIGGNTTAGNLNSYAYRLNDGRLKRLQNNILYNERTGGGGVHYAIGAMFNPYPNPKWTSTSSNFNFFVAKDSANIGAWGFTNAPQSMISWRTVSQGDSNSFAALNTNLPSASFFQSYTTGNLNINSSNPLCWYVNGKGLPVTTISSDFDSATNIRSTAITTGATDIGSDEFNTSTLPPVLLVTGRHLPGFTDSLILNERLIATITWGNTGTLPTIGSARYYSGTWPNDTTNGFSVSNARTMNAWLDIPVTGGSGYSYTLTFFYDSSMLGKAQNISQIVLHKKNAGETGSWQMLFPSQTNTALKKITAIGLTSFSEFTGAEFNSPLSQPGGSTCSNGIISFKTDKTGGGYTYQWEVNTGSGFASLTNDGVYSGAADSVLTITAPTSAYNRYQYRCISNTGSGLVNSTTYLLKIINSWNGANDTNWENPLNWSCGQVPDANTDVLIKSGLTNYPTINTNVVCRSIIASSGSVIQVNPGATLHLSGQ